MVGLITSLSRNRNIIYRDLPIESMMKMLYKAAFETPNCCDDQTACRYKRLLRLQPIGD